MTDHEIKNPMKKKSQVRGKSTERDAFENWWRKRVLKENMI